MPVERRRYIKAVGGAAIAGLAGCTGQQGDGGGGSTPTETGQQGDGGDGGGGSTPTETPMQTTAKSSKGELEVTDVSYLGTYFPDAVFGSLHAAEEKGFFEEVGLNVNIQYTLQIQNILQVMLSGKYDFVGHTPIATLLASAKGIPIRHLATHTGHPPTSFFSKAEDNIKSVKDWPGHTLGLQNENDRLWFTHEMYQDVGFSQEQINNINQVFTGYSIKNLMTGKVDILSGYPTNSDFNSLRLAGEEFNIQYAMDYVDVPGNNLITTGEFHEKHPNTTKAFLHAYTKGTEYAFLNPDHFKEMAKITVQKLEEADANVFLRGVDPVKVEINNYKQLAKFKPTKFWETQGIGWSAPKRWDNLQQIGLEIGDLSTEQDIDKIIGPGNELIKQIHDDDGDLIWPPE